jgi:hypothetical protein
MRCKVRAAVFSAIIAIAMIIPGAANANTPHKLTWLPTQVASCSGQIIDDVSSVLVNKPNADTKFASKWWSNGVVGTWSGYDPTLTTVGGVSQTIGFQCTVNQATHTQDTFRAWGGIHPDGVDYYHWSTSGVRTVEDIGIPGAGNILSLGAYWATAPSDRYLTVYAVDGTGALYINYRVGTNWVGWQLWSAFWGVADPPVSTSVAACSDQTSTVNFGWADVFVVSGHRIWKNSRRGTGGTATWSGWTNMGQNTGTLDGIACTESDPAQTPLTIDLVSTNALSGVSHATFSGSVWSAFSSLGAFYGVSSVSTDWTYTVTGQPQYDVFAVTGNGGPSGQTVYHRARVGPTWLWSGTHWCYEGDNGGANAPAGCGS